MTGQFYKTPQGFFRSIIFLGAENLWGDFLFYWAANSQVFRLLDCGLLFVGAQTTPFFLLAGNCLAFPKYSRPPCSIKHLVSSTLWNSQKGAEQAGKAEKIVKETS